MNNKLRMLALTAFSISSLSIVAACSEGVPSSSTPSSIRDVATERTPTERAQYAQRVFQNNLTTVTLIDVALVFAYQQQGAAATPEDIIAAINNLTGSNLTADDFDSPFPTFEEVSSFIAPAGSIGLVDVAAFFAVLQGAEGDEAIAEFVSQLTGEQFFASDIENTPGAPSPAPEPSPTTAPAPGPAPAPAAAAFGTTNIADQSVVVNTAITDIDLNTFFTGTGLTFTVTTGTLPAGVTIDANGVITGTPTVVGESAGLVITATDSATNTATSNPFTLAATAAALPAVTVNQLVSPNFFNGSGNDNGSFVVGKSADNTVELGLRAQIRFDANNDPEGPVDSDNGVYIFAAGVPNPGFGFAQPPGDTRQARWNFAWSINVGAGRALNALTYQIRIDYDPANGNTDAAGFVVFDPINSGISTDHALGAAGTSAVDIGQDGTTNNSANYAANIANTAFNVAQNSWNLYFFRDAAAALSPSLVYNGADPGQYTVTLTAFEAGIPIAETSILVDQD